MQRHDLRPVSIEHLDQGLLAARDIRSDMLRRLFRQAFAALLGLAGRTRRLAGRALAGQPRPRASALPQTKPAPLPISDAG